MQLDKLIIQGRLRNSWSAIDLGVKLAQRYWLACATMFAMLALPCYLLLHFSFAGESGWGIFLIWWLKPLFERPLLFFLSRELFQNSSGIVDTIRQFRQWSFKGIFAQLSYRRLSPCRSMYSPIYALEGSTGAQYAKRASVLGATHSSAATGLTIVLIHFENFFYYSILASIALFAPDYISEVFDNWFSEGYFSFAGVILFDLLVLFVLSAVAPFYVAGGFMLYISRRIELEGWDIEICFREWLLQSQDQDVLTPSPQRMLDA